jgi:plastocyanin
LNVKRTSLFVLAIACVALVAAGCGGSKKKSESTQAQTSAPAQTTTGQTTTSGGAAAGSNLKLSADPSGQLKFDKSSLSAKAGDVTITMDNPSSAPHAVAVKGNGIDKDGQTVQQGGTSKVTVALKPGNYEFYCPVDGHEQAGMKGTLTVK